MARNETKSVIFSSEKRKNERVMIEFAILKDKLTMSRCCSLNSQLLNKLSPVLGAIARMVPIVWKTRGDPNNHLERGRLALHADGKVSLKWGPLSLRCHAFSGKEGRCVKSQGVAAV